MCSSDLSLVGRVSRARSFLHDGRARTVAEAILWHGGEAAARQERFRTAPKSDRDALLAYVEGL